MNPWHKRIAVVVASAAAFVLFTSTAASAQPVTPRDNEGWISMTQRTCGNSASWQEQARRNGVTGSPWIAILGKTYDIQCGSAPAQPAAQPAAPAASGWANPLPGRCLGSGFRTSSRPGHNGVDIPAASGTPIRAAAAGTVGLGNQPSGAGLYVTLRHSNGTATTYFHMSSRAVSLGQWVNAGQVIGYVGSTGNSTGPHLHFEVHPWGLWNGQTNPTTFMANHGARIGC